MRLFQLVVIGLFAVALGSIHARADEAAADQKPEQVNVFGAGTLQVPSAFKRIQARSRIVEHEFEATAGEGDDAKTARITMMAAGGDIDANIQRWRGQFSGGDKDDQKTEQMKLGKWQVYIVDLAGTYAESMGGGPFAPGKKIQRSDYAMAGAILASPDGRKYFVKMIGPAAVVKTNHKAFVEMIKSIEK